ncbi:hypothetical protein [Scytonema sp. NUACC26]|uniref:hypothetical protein n=1 Tax=Scytonema sp. NUACC26 TaxID=3140176 RepID=UPI0034DB9F08
MYDNFNIKQVNTGNGRHYEINNNGNLYKLISVTSLLDKVKPKEALFAWRKSVGEEEAQRITTTAANRGTKAHGYVEDYLLKRVLPTPSNDESYKCFENLLPVVNLIQPIEIEKKTYWVNEYGYGFAGTKDMWASINGAKLVNRATNQVVADEQVSFIGDIKTWNKAKYPYASNREGERYYPLISYGLQLSAYAAATNQRTSGNAAVNRAFIFGVTNNCRAPFIYYFSPEAVMFYWNKMKQIVDCYYTNTNFNWVSFEKEADRLGFLGDRCDLI